MAEPNTNLFGKLNIRYMYSLGIYVSGIILISSFLVVPAGVELTVLRIQIFRILMMSVIFKEISNVCIKLSDYSFFAVSYWVLKVIYVFAVIETAKPIV